jgi:hypothetical protein
MTDASPRAATPFPASLIPRIVATMADALTSLRRDADGIFALTPPAGARTARDARRRARRRRVAQAGDEGDWLE